MSLLDDISCIISNDIQLNNVFGNYAKFVSSVLSASSVL